MYSLELTISCDDPDICKVIYLSILPERDDAVAISPEKNTLKVNIDARTITRLRAITNSYLRWMYTIEKVMEVVDNGQKPS